MTIEQISFLHFNDVYNAEKSPPFVSSIKNTRNELQQQQQQQEASSSPEGRQVVTVFSGDAFSPSIMSTILRGEQMVPVLNALDIDVACLGNHDLDFGLQEFTELSEACNFPWLCSNAFDAHTNQPLGGCKEYLIMEKNGSKILFVGIVEDAWLDTLASLDPSDIIFESPSDYVKRRVPQLIEECGPFDMVVAVTHMRMPNDIALANECGRGGGGKDGEGGFIDIVLGGHDHHYEDIITNDVRILNSGADFKSYTVVDVHGRSNVTNALETSSRRVDITSNDKPDVDVVQSIQQYKEAVDASMDIVVGRTKTTLDARFGEIRRRETNISNFLAELMTRGTGADVAILNAGSIRADREVEGGELVMRDLCDLLPMADELMVIEVTAERILLALENGVSQYPAMEGRFPCVDGVRFAFDPSKPAGSRVVPGSVYVRDQPLVPKRHIILRGGQTAVTSTTTSIDTIQNGLEKSSLNDDKMEKVVDNSKENAAPKGYSALDFNRKYSLVSKAYLIEGKDGFDKAFVGAPVLQDADQCPLLPTLLRNIFTELRTLEFWKGTTVEGTVLRAASKFKRLARKSVADPFAINPMVDGRILNLAEA